MILWWALSLLAVSSLAQRCINSDSSPGIPCAGTNSQEECESYGCCWTNGSPYCYFETPKYIVKYRSNTKYGVKLILGFEDETAAARMPGSPISPLVMDLTQETEYRLHIKISDPNNKRWEIPESILPTPPPTSKPVESSKYDYQLPKVGEEFFFSVFRRYYNTSIFNTSSIGLFFGDQFLKIGTTLAPEYNIYGLGEQKRKLKLEAEQIITLWNIEKLTTPTPEDLNLYGSHPFYMQVMEDGLSHGVFLRNSNGMDINLKTTSLVYKVIGGVLDFYFFLGSSPSSVVQQYQEVIGRPAMPPYWALGFHQSRWGYKNLVEIQEVLSNYAKNKIPLDTIWTDIDYMDTFRDFTTDPVLFPTANMRQLIKKVHNNGQHYVVIVNPAIPNAQNYKPYQDGLGMDIFIRDWSHNIFFGEIWPGMTAYPDFSNPLAAKYWRIQISDFLKKVPVDGLWLDMNEPSNRCSGACNRTNYPRKEVGFDPVYPAYQINNQGSKAPLNHKTLDMDAVLQIGLAYNAHNLYGLMESIATRRALISVYKGKRPFVLSRSTFPGSGAHAAHWLGDNYSKESDLYFSIPGILNFQILGVPLVGADICGFGGHTTEELCARWMELGAFYPFSRNHNSLNSLPQEPYRWESVAAISRKVLGIRYSLLPYYYTLFFKITTKSHPEASTVLRPLFFDFPGDKIALSIDTQFLVGSGILISPQLKLGSEGKSLDMYLPASTWYDWYTGDVVPTSGKNITVPTPLDHIPIHVRGGHIIPIQEPGLTTNASRKNPYSLLVALAGGSASGDIYLDDGVTHNTTDYTYVDYSCKYNTVTSSVQGTKFATKWALPLLMNVTVLGVANKPTVLTLNGTPKNFTFSEGRPFKLMVNNLNINMDTEFTLSWK